MSEEQIFYLNENNENIILNFIESLKENKEKIENEANVHKIVYHLWTLAKFKVQVEFCEKLMNEIKSLENKEEIIVILFKILKNEWKKIENNRKDKFYFLVSLIIKEAVIIFNIEQVFEHFLYGYGELENYILTTLEKEIKLKDPKFLILIINYMSKCDCAYTFYVFKTDIMKLYKMADQYVIKHIFEIASNKNTSQNVREIFYIIYEKYKK